MLQHTMTDDFQGDSLGQWASYPPAQDIGYEPSISPTSEFGAPGGRSLMRAVQPTRSGSLRFGFIKKAAFTFVKGSRIAFSYRVNTPAGAPIIEVCLAGTDGRRYSADIKAAANVWTRAEINTADLRPSNSGQIGVEAIYLIVKLPESDPDVTYRFIIDDISVNAARPAQFAFVSPEAEAFEPWNSSISRKGFKPNDRFSIEARSPVPMSEAEFLLTSADGKPSSSGKLYDDGTHGDKRSGDGIWSNDTVHQFQSTDAPGIWKASITGKTSAGFVAAAELRFLLYPPTSDSHPRLYFRAEARSTLEARTHDENLAKTWEYILSTAKATQATGDLESGGRTFELLDDKYLLPSLLGYFDVVNRARSRIAHNAFVGYLTNDETALASAKRALLDVTHWPRWEPPWFRAHGQHTYYPAGLLAIDVALGYDLLYDRLTESERSQIRVALIEKEIIPSYKEYFLDNRAMADTSNWISHTVGGALIAASAIAGDVTQEESGGNFDLYVNGLLLKIEAHMAAGYLADGSYGEGISYQEFDMESLAPMLTAVKRSFGVDYLKTTHVETSLYYALYTLTEPREASPDMGDTHPPAGHGISPLIYRSKDPVMRWYYSRFERPSLQKFIFYDNSVAPRSPTEAGLPTSRIFQQKGNAVFRTGWGEDSITMLFRAGPNFNHHHADQGSFLITAFGEPLVTEAGWSDYYKDPYYATFFTQAIGHNTVLVNGDPESQVIPDTPQYRALDDYPRITDSITSEFFDGVAGDISSVYPVSLERYTRRIVFIKPYYFVVFDDLKTRGEPVRFDFLLHLPDRAAIKTSGLTAVYNGPKASLAVRSFSPDDSVLTVKDGRIPYQIFSTQTPAETPKQPAFLDFRSNMPANEMQFVTALVPARSTDAAAGLIGKMVPFAGDNLKGIRVERLNETDLIIFRTTAETAAMHYGEWTANAAFLAVTNTVANLKTFSAQGARSVTKGKLLMFSAETPVSIAASYNAGQIDAVINSKTETKTHLYVGSRPVRVLLDGKILAANVFDFDPAAAAISLKMPAGQHEIKIVLK